MSDPHTQQGQDERAKRLRQQIENLKSGTPSSVDPEHKKSLREQIEERSKEIEDREKQNS